MMYYYCITQFLDINECNNGTNFCEDTCNNFIGGYSCSCADKTQVLSNDGYRCLSIKLKLLNDIWYYDLLF